MKDALTRLRALQQELETLHRTTADVLAQSQRLIGELEQPSLRVVTPKPAVRPVPKRKRAPGAAPHARKCTTPWCGRRLTSHSSRASRRSSK